HCTPAPLCTPEGAESPARAPPEQSPPGLPPIEPSGLEPAGSKATVTPVTSSESTLGAVSWMLPLVWLEKTLNASFLVESLRHSLPFHKPQQDASSGVTPVPTAVASTSTTPVPFAVTGTSITPVSTVVAGISTTPVPTAVTGTSITPMSVHVPRCMGLWHLWAALALSPLSVPSCPREQLKTLPRAELEGRLESTLIIIEALSLQLRDWQESQGLRPGVGPAKQRDVLTQTDITHPEGEEEIWQLCLELRGKTEAVQWQQGAERHLQRELVSLSLPQSTWSSQCLLLQGLADAAFRSLRDEQGALTQEREQERPLVSQCHTVPESIPSKLQSCLEERDAIRQRVDE
ncbi:SPAG5 protein, partial [Pomatostomus ruficeps]|nr:SPAG5 protein [Pomatostomus ruficeps]